MEEEKKKLSANRKRSSLRERSLLVCENSLSLSQDIIHQDSEYIINITRHSKLSTLSFRERKKRKKKNDDFSLERALSKLSSSLIKKKYDFLFNYCAQDVALLKLLWEEAHGQKMLFYLPKKKYSTRKIVPLENTEKSAFEFNASIFHEY